MYFIEEHYLYTYIGSSDRGVRISEKGATGVPSGRPAQVRWTLRKGSAEGAVIGGSYLRR